MKRLKDFSRAQIKKIATEYARSGLEYNHSYFEREYNISENTFYNMLRKSIVESIVGEETAKQIGDKASKNSAEKAGERAGFRTKRSNTHLLLKRKQFRFSRQDAKKIAIQYSKSKLSKEGFCEANAIPIKLFDDALIRAITCNWIDDECYERLKSKAIKNNSSRAYKFFQGLEKLRNAHKK